jgi:hypothetical protein
LKYRLVLTSEEKRVVTFVVAAFLLGTATKCYRDRRPAPAVKIEKKHSGSHAGRPGASAKSD